MSDMNDMTDEQVAEAVAHGHREGSICRIAADCIRRLVRERKAANQIQYDGNTQLHPYEGKMILGKRFPVFAEIMSPCPKCRHLRVVDDATIDHPIIGSPEAVYLACPECGHDWKVTLIVRLSYELVPTRGRL